MAAQNNAIRTNHIKARIDKTQQNSKCRLSGDRWNYQSHNKRMQKIGTEGVQSETRLGRMVIHWEMCKKFKFDHANKWYMHNPAPVLEDDTNNLLWDFDI